MQTALHAAPRTQDSHAENQPPHAAPSVSRGLRSDWPSLLFMALVAGNVAAIAWVSNPFLLAMLVLLQSVLLLGCQEAKHMCVHRSFLSPKWANDAMGALCAALLGVNFFAYRHFHFEHHKFTCTDRDPEGQLYAQTWRTRWLWAAAPGEVVWIAWHMNKAAWAMTPPAARLTRNLGMTFVVALLSGLAVLAWYFPVTVLLAWALPVALGAYFDMMLSQSEHYDAPIVSAAERRDPSTVSLNIRMPMLLSWLMLHRPLHEVHHSYPGLRWFDAPKYMHHGPKPIAYLDFAKRWMTQGPRLWREGFVRP